MIGVRLMGGFTQVCTPADIEYLVKESEVVTGNPGRKFVIYGADRLIYRIAWHPNGYHVQRLDESDKHDQYDVPAARAIQRAWLRRSALSWPALYACVVALKELDINRKRGIATLAAMFLEGGSRALPFLSIRARDCSAKIYPAGS